MVALIDESTDDTWSVLEVSSFQLESTEQFHPSIAVILNITPDHLDRHGSFENYALAKERIFAAQTAQDCLVLNADNARAARGRGPLGRQGLLVFRRASGGAGRLAGGMATWSTAPARDAATEQVMPLQRNPAQGRAQRGERAGRGGAPRGWPALRPSAIRQAVESFQAVEHRLEYVATINGVEFYNDSKATNVDATAKAVAAFDSGIHLILGGKDKGSDYTAARRPAARSGCAPSTPSARRRPRSSPHLRGVVSIHSCETLDKAVERGRRRGAPRRGGAAGAGLLQLRPV